jgi:FixJ family two-component response regulator
VTSPDRLVFVVDDDYRVCRALQELLASAGLPSVTLGSAAEYIAHPKPDVPTCLVLDLELPDISGLDLQQQIGNAYHPPIIFISAHAEISSTVRAMRAGALGFLTKPCSDRELLALIDEGFTADFDSRAEQARLAYLKQRFQSLTPREREVLPLIVSGLLNKQAAALLGISLVTLQIHRTNMMRKMEADSVADLVRMADFLKIPISHRRHA